jgi:hypothetical protein
VTRTNTHELGTLQAICWGCGRRVSRTIRTPSAFAIECRNQATKSCPRLEPNSLSCRRHSPRSSDAETRSGLQMNLITSPYRVGTRSGCSIARRRQQAARSRPLKGTNPGQMPKAPPEALAGASKPEENIAPSGIRTTSPTRVFSQRVTGILPQCSTQIPGQQRASELICVRCG